MQTRQCLLQIAWRETAQLASWVMQAAAKGHQMLMWLLVDCSAKQVQIHML